RSSDHYDLHSFPTRRSSDLFPVIIEPGTIKNLPLNFKPAASQTYSGYVRFYHNDPIYTYSEVTVKGNGIYTEPYLGLSSSSINRSEEHTSELQSRENLVCRL